MSGFGAGLGTLIGSSLGAEDLDKGVAAVNGTAGDFNSTVAPYNTFGQSFLQPAAAAIGGVQNAAGQTLGYDDFMKNYTMSPGTQYQLQQGQEAQNASAASTGQLLSGTNQRALSTISQGIASTGANNAYDEYLKGNNQQFGQLESALGNMFGAIGIGTQATGQQAGIASSQMAQQSALAQAQSKNDSGKGSGLGSMFSGLGSIAAMF